MRIILSDEATARTARTQPRAHAGAASAAVGSAADAPRHQAGFEGHYDQLALPLHGGLNTGFGLAPYYPG
eukprot:5803793-Pleurochrysis_carterae.AAC.3